MDGFRYIDNTATLRLDRQCCVGCGSCVVVCPHRLFRVEQKKAEIIDVNGCMECGACARNCPVNAISVNPGVGCAGHIIAHWVNNFFGRKILKGCF